ncbi:MAG: class I SAM-dependent methyltransferase [Mycobacterium sp.]
MARTDNDTWDLASSVGATATVVAMQRAMATRGPRPLIYDPYAEPLVAAVGLEDFTRYARGEIDTDGAPFDVHRMSDGIAARTKYFDDFFADATAAGIRQAVIFASGLDARAYRLRWPAGTTVFELDQPQVIEFKTGVLADQGAVPAIAHRPIGIDLRDDWPAALRANGFDPALPTAWIAEGLLIYLPADAQDRLLENVTALSAPGSRIAAENTGTITADELTKIGEQMRAAQEQWQGKGIDGFGAATEIDITELFYAGERTESAVFLGDRGWTVNLHKSSELYAMYGLQPPIEGLSAFGDITYLTAVLG